MTPIRAELVGGLGNQLFIYAAALEQSKRLRVGLELDTRWFHTQDKREFQLDQVFNVKSSTKERQGFLSRLAGTTCFSHRSLTTYREGSSRFDSSIFEIAPGTTISGYFQATEYFPTVGKSVTEGILHAKVSDFEQAIISRICTEPFNAIHVRRGDYSEDTVTREFHGLTTARYFKDGVENFRNGFRTLVFSDSEESAKLELKSISGLVYDPDLSFLGDVATLKLMSHAQGLVMSNSSFSWWAAFSIYSRNCESVIVAPRPWSKNIDLNKELLPADWIIGQL